MKLFALGIKNVMNREIDTLFDRSQEANVMRCGLISWTKSDYGGCACVLPLLDVTERGLSVTFHCSFTETPEQLMGASEKPINSNIPAIRLVMSVAILPQQLQGKTK